MWDLQRRGSSLNEIIASLAKEKPREDCRKKYLHKDFSSEAHNGFKNDVEIVFIDKTDPMNRTRREEFWRTFIKIFECRERTSSYVASLVALVLTILLILSCIM